MKSKLTKSNLIGFLVLASFCFFSFPHSAVAVDDMVASSASKSDYQLPDPGILSDHPLYIFKKVRDYLLEATISDDLKKIDLYLSLSDKSVAMAGPLLEQGKITACNNALVEAEQTFSEIIPLIKKVKNTGAELPDGLITKLKSSNLKHREMIQFILKKLPKGDLDQVESALKINARIRDSL